MKPTTEEKDFNRAMCTTCLLDWPMAQCLSCKFHIPEKEVEFDPNTMEMNMDYRTTTKVLQAVEQASLEQMVAENPDNTYWEKRLAEFLANCNPADVAQRIEQEIDSTEHSPYISGGEILWVTYPTGNDDIPF